MTKQVKIAKENNKIISTKVFYVAENTGWTNGVSWFPTYELGYDTEEAALEANKRHQKSFSGKIKYRVTKVTTTRELLFQTP